jgi:hypothetical protein
MSFLRTYSKLTGQFSEIIGVFFFSNTCLSTRHCILEQAVEKTGANREVAELHKKFKEKKKETIQG